MSCSSSSTRLPWMRRGASSSMSGSESPNTVDETMPFEFLGEPLVLVEGCEHRADLRLDGVRVGEACLVEGRGISRLRSFANRSEGDGRYNLLVGEGIPRGRCLSRRE